MEEAKKSNELQDLINSQEDTELNTCSKWFLK